MRTLEEIMAHLDKYEHFDGKGGLKVFPPSKRRFQWKENSEWSLKEFLGLQIEGYYREIGSPDKIKDDANEWYERSIEPSLESVRKIIEALIKATETTSSRRVPKKLKNILQALNEVEPEIRETLTPGYQRTIGEINEGLGELGEDGAETRLRIRLEDVFKAHSNLTFENKIHHIVRLLYHFEIITDETHKDSESAFEAVERTFTARSKKERDKIKWSQILDSMGEYTRHDEV